MHAGGEFGLVGKQESRWKSKIDSPRHGAGKVQSRIDCLDSGAIAVESLGVDGHWPAAKGEAKNVYDGSGRR